jgi:hypothetical protein
MRKTLVGVAFGLAAMGVLATTCPGAEAHRAAVVERVRMSCGESMFVRALCGSLVQFAGSNLRYRDWHLFSTGRLGQMETFGALGQVVVVKED